MPINDKYKIIYFHIPKTAGSSIEKMLEMEYDKKNILKKLNNHDNTYDCPAYQHFIPEKLRPYIKSSHKWDTYHKCVSVRNPYDRAVSSYEFCKKQKFIINSETSFYNFLTKAYSIVHKYDVDDDIYDLVPFLHHFRPQKHWFQNHDLYDILIRYEHLDEDVDHLKKIINCKNKMPHILQRSDRKDIKHYYDKNTLLLFDKVYGCDLCLSPKNNVIYERIDI